MGIRFSAPTSHHEEVNLGGSEGTHRESVAHHGADMGSSSGVPVRGTNSGTSGLFTLFRGDQHRTNSFSGVSPDRGSRQSHLSFPPFRSATFSDPDSPGSSIPADDDVVVTSTFRGFSFLPRHMVAAHSLPAHFWPPAEGVRCPVCDDLVPLEDLETHLVGCLGRSRLEYNEDILTEEKGECIICLEDLEAGHTIARLPCLCIFHKECIEMWFHKKYACPVHPDTKNKDHGGNNGEEDLEGSG